MNAGNQDRHAGSSPDSDLSSESACACSLFRIVWKRNYSGGNVKQNFKLRSWQRLIVWSLLTAATVWVLHMSFHTAASRLMSWRIYALSFIYSLCIGVPLSLFAEPVWRWSCSWPLAARWLGRSLFVTLGTALGCLVAGAVEPWILGGEASGYWANFWGSFGVAIILSAAITIFTSMSEQFKDKLRATQLQLKEKEIERERALKIAAEATLSSLESRIHPHFLFNTINSISALIREDPARAEKMLSQMASLLRFSLDSGQIRLVPLSSELKIVHDYLEIEKARFEDRLRYRVEVPSEFDDVPFPPLSLQTLVENSVKYAVGVTRAGADIAIRAHRDQDNIVLSVEDNGPGFDAQSLPAGHGLSSLKERLHSLYQGAAQFSVSSSGGRTVVGLHVPARL